MDNRSPGVSIFINRYGAVPCINGIRHFSPRIGFGLNHSSINIYIRTINSIYSNNVRIVSFRRRMNSHIL